jgi:phthalate 4,5-cis-dihydrodiol dehydrogenase
MNLGIIGYGYTGQQHATALASIEGVTLCAIAEVDERKRAMASAPTFADYRVLVENQSIDAVTICLPHYLHEDVASAALSAGKHVLVEKPLTMRASTGRALCNLAKTKTRILMVEMTHRFLPPLLEAKRLVAKGDIGDIMVVDELLVEDVGLFGSLPGWMLDRDRSGGGVGFTSGIHLLDHISWICQQRLTLQAASFSYGQQLGNIEDTAAFALKTDRGIPVHVQLYWRKQGAGLDGHLRIVGTKGSLKVWPWGWIRIQSDTNTGQRSFFPEQSTIAERALVGMRGALQEFVDAIRQNRLPDPPPEGVSQQSSNY